MTAIHVLKLIIIIKKKKKIDPVWVKHQHGILLLVIISCKKLSTSRQHMSNGREKRWRQSDM